jgi:hypothetical protein
MEVGQNMVIETMRLALEVVSLVGMQTKTMCPGEDHTTSHCIMTASMSQETSEEQPLHYQPRSWDLQTHVTMKIWHCSNLPQESSSVSVVHDQMLCIVRPLTTSNHQSSGKYERAEMPEEKYSLLTCPPHVRAAYT